MNSRRELIATLGVVTVAGCTTQPQENNTTEPGGSSEPDTEELAIPFNGLGMYEEAVRTADPLEKASEDPRGDPQLTGDQIQDMLDGAETVEEEAMFLAENTHTNYLHSAMQQYHQAKEEGENMVVANINWSFTSDSEPIIEYHTVKNGELQGQPIIADANTNIKTHKPGQNNPEYLANLRQTRGAGRIAQDYDGLKSLMETIEEHNGLSEEEQENMRKITHNKMSYAVFGMEDQDFIFYDADSANFAAEPVQGDNSEAAQAMADLANQLPEADAYQAEGWTSAEYTESGWEFRTHPDYEPGNKLPGEQ